MTQYNKKYPGYNENDIHYDDYHRSRGMMTNREFFTSNGPGGFYEGLEWDGENDEWIPNAATRQKEWEMVQERLKNTCSICGYEKKYCYCE